VDEQIRAALAMGVDRPFASTIPAALILRGGAYLRADSREKEAPHVVIYGQQAWTMTQTRSVRSGGLLGWPQADVRLED